MVHFALLPNTIGHRTSQPDIVDLVEDADLASHKTRVTDSPPNGWGSSNSWKTASVTWYFRHPSSSSTLAQLPRHGNIRNSTNSSPRIHREKKNTDSRHHSWTRHRPIMGISTRHEYHHYPVRPGTWFAAGNNPEKHRSSHHDLIIAWA